VVESVRQLGWPLLPLAVVGGWAVWRHRSRDPLTCLLLAWVGVWLALVSAHVLHRVDAPYERYAIEFLGRVNLATYPAIVILAARAVGGTSTSVVGRAVLVTIAGLAGWLGLRSWLGWFAGGG